MKNKKNKLLTYSFLSIISIAPIGIISSCSHKEEINNRPVDKPDDNVSPEIPTDISKLSKFDARDYGWVTPVKNQLTDDLCWAYAASSTCETSMLKNGLWDKNKINQLDISEYNINFLTRVRTNEADKLNLTTNDTFGNINNLPKTANNPILAIDMLGQNNGPWIGKNWLDKNNSIDNPESYKYHEPVAKLESCKIMIENNVQQVKNEIAKNGSVAISYAAGFNKPEQQKIKDIYRNTFGLNYVDHGCCIVGWDDNIDKNNFNPIAKQNGAWIVKNSWGIESGLNGYFYLSYDSPIQVLSYNYQSSNNYQNTYYYNGMQDIQGHVSRLSSKHVGAIFEGLKANELENEFIKSISFSIQGFNNNVQIEIYKDVEANMLNRTDKINNPVSGKLITTVNTTCDFPGYYTVDLPNEIQINKNQKFSVVLKILSDDPNSRIATSEEVNSTNDMTFYESTKSPGKWLNCATLKSSETHKPMNLVAAIRANTLLKKNKGR